MIVEQDCREEHRQDEQKYKLEKYIKDSKAVEQEMILPRVEI